MLFANERVNFIVKYCNIINGRGKNFILPTELKRKEKSKNIQSKPENSKQLLQVTSEEKAVFGPCISKESEGHDHKRNFQKT